MMANLPTDFFSSKALVQRFQALLQNYGSLVSWVPQPAFGQCLVVFERSEDAQRVKHALDWLPWPYTGMDGALAPCTAHAGDGPRLRVYLHHPTRLTGQPSNTCAEPFSQAHDAFLAPPTLERQFLISPPGSPPVGWEPREEDRPNTDTLAEDLIDALILHTQMEAPGVPSVLVPPGAASVPGVVLDTAEPCQTSRGRLGDGRPTARPPLHDTT